MQNKNLDHLFRHHYGKMVAILVRIFGISHLEIIEDAVQDTFLKAINSWRKKLPDHPEAWLTKAAKNRVIDLFRKLKASKEREFLVQSNAEVIAINELFLETEIEDSQLRMIFAACHPKLNTADQITFALKTISGFSTEEIATALFVKKETVKKRLARARKTIKKQQLSFSIPQGKELNERMDSVINVLYLIFNEGFHSNNKLLLIRKDLCGEAFRLCQLLLKKEYLRTSNLYALFSLISLHTARLESKLLANEIIDIKNQDRNLWYQPLIKLGQSALVKAYEADEISRFHLEASIANYHIIAKSFEETNWAIILKLNEELYKLQPTPVIALNISLVYLQLSAYENALKVLNKLSIHDFKQRSYLFYGTWAEYYIVTSDFTNAINYLENAIIEVTNELEKNYLIKKKESLLAKIV